MLALVLLAAQTSFTPALDHGTRPVAEWLRELDHPERATDAAWCVYYADDRSPAALDALRAALATPEAPWAHQAIDAILAAWGVGFELLPTEAFCSAGGCKAPEDLFELPDSAIPGTPEQLLAWVYADDARFALGAAVTLLARDEHARRALAWFGRAFDAGRLDTATLNWLREQARHGWGEVLGQRIARALAEGGPDDAEIARCLAELERPYECVRGAVEVLVDLAATHGPHADRAAELVHAASQGLWGDTLDDWELHGPSMTPVDDPELERALSRHYGRLIDLAAHEGNIEPDLLAEIAVRIPRYPGIASVVEAGLLELLESDTEERLAILNLLGHMPSADPRVRSAWLETARGWQDFSEESLGLFPCPPTADDETLEVLLDVLHKSEHGWLFTRKLRFLGLLDADRSPHVRWLLEHLGSWPSSWWEVVLGGFRGLVDEPVAMPPEIASSLDDGRIMVARALRMHRLALNCATRKDRGEDFSADEQAMVELLELEYPYGGAGGYDDYVQSGFWWAKAIGLRSDALIGAALFHARLPFPEGWGSHCDAAVAFLEATELSIERQVDLERELTAHLGGRSKGKVALERTPQMRRTLYQGNIWALDELARCTRLVGRDLDYLEAVLARGRAGMRVWALELVERERIDSARVREAVHKRLTDVDGEVRHRARTVTETMGW